MPITVALIGAGQTARPHLKAYVWHEQVRDVVLVDPDPVARAALRAEFGIIKHEAEDLASALQLARPQWADLCCRPEERLGYLRQAVEAGLDVIVERPLAATVQDCDEIVALAQASGRRIMACMPQWHLPAHQRLGELLTCSEAGEKLAGMVIASGGGEDPWLAVHEATAFLQHVLGPAQAVYTSVTSPGADEEGVQDPTAAGPTVMMVHLEFAGGRQGGITLCVQPEVNTWTEERRVFTTAGMLLVRDNPEDEMPLVAFAGNEFRPIRVLNPPAVREWAAREAVLRLTDALLAGMPAPVTVEDAREVVATWEAARTSAETQTRIVIPQRPTC